MTQPVEIEARGNAPDALAIDGPRRGLPMTEATIHPAAALDLLAAQRLAREVEAHATALRSWSGLRR
jgi:hypothetical protein